MVKKHTSKTDPRIYSFAVAVVALISILCIVIFALKPYLHLQSTGASSSGLSADTSSAQSTNTAGNAASDEAVPARANIRVDSAPFSCGDHIRMSSGGSFKVVSISSLTQTVTLLQDDGTTQSIDFASPVPFTNYIVDMISGECAVEDDVTTRDGTVYLAIRD